MNKLANWTKGHQTTAFFVIAFAITWGLGYSYGAVMNEGIFLLAPVVVIATCGPALAGIIISAVINNQPREGTNCAYWIAFIVALVVSTIVFLANNTILNHAPFSPIMVIFSLVSVVPVAFVISMTYSCIPAVKRYLYSLIRLRGLWGWSFLALVLMPALILLSIIINSFRGGQPITSLSFPASGPVLIGLIVVKFFYQFFFFNATGRKPVGAASPSPGCRQAPVLS